MNARAGDAADLLRELFGRIPEEMPGEAPRTDGIPLTAERIAALEAAGNRSDDWSRVLVSPGSDLGRIESCLFAGDVLLDACPAGFPDDRSGRTVLRDSTIEDSEIGAGCRVVSTGLLSGIRLGRGAVVERCGRVSFRPGSPCGSGTPLQLGVETGERAVRSFPLLDVGTAAALSGGSGACALGEEYGRLLDGFLAELGSRRLGTVGAGASLTDTPVIADCYVGPGVTVSCACAVRDSTLLGGTHPCSVTDGALVRGSILKRASRVDSMAVVEGSVVDEAATVERHGKLTVSLLGPNSALAGGEITASLAGPFTAAHHQSLLIAAWWPSGRGNLGYGANVGSNHTSRLPDQEIRPGEGMFFGLGCSVKFPSDFRSAPWSILATGVTTLPQRVAFPFSLICEPFETRTDVPPAFGQIVPAWVLAQSFYSVVRNDRKIRGRNRAPGWRDDRGILRGEIADLLEAAADALSAAAPAPVHLERSLPGLGCNFLLEEDRLSAIGTYRFHALFHAMRRLADLLGGGAGFLRLMEGPPVDADWDRCRKRIGALHPGEGPDVLLARLGSMWSTLAEEVAGSRMRDDSRGARIVEDYPLFHRPAAEDPVIAGFRAEAAEAAAAVERLIRTVR